MDVVLVGMFVMFGLIGLVVVIVVLTAVRTRKRGQAQRRSAWGAGTAAAGGLYYGASTGTTGCTGSQYWADREFGTSQPSPHYGGDSHHGHSGHDHGGSSCSGGSSCGGGNSCGGGSSCGGGGGD